MSANRPDSTSSVEGVAETPDMRLVFVFNDEITDIPGATGSDGFHTLWHRRLHAILPGMTGREVEMEGLKIVQLELDGRQITLCGPESWIMHGQILQTFLEQAKVPFELVRGARSGKMFPALQGERYTVVGMGKLGAGRMQPDSASLDYNIAVSQGFNERFKALLGKNPEEQ